MLRAILGMGSRGRVEASVSEQLALDTNGMRFATYRELLPLLTSELRRCRRYERSLAVLVLSPDRDGALGERPERGAPDHVRFFLLGSLLRDVVRETDIAIYHAEDHCFGLFMPEANADGARLAIARIGNSFYQRTDTSLRVGVAEFPKDGLTVQDLFDRARDVWQSDGHAALAPQPTTKLDSRASGG